MDSLKLMRFSCQKRLVVTLRPIILQNERSKPGLGQSWGPRILPLLFLLALLLFAWSLKGWGMLHNPPVGSHQTLEDQQLRVVAGDSKRQMWKKERGTASLHSE